MFCGECGTNNRNDSKFCVNCGSKLHDYTKPKENLIMPEEIEAKQKNILKVSKVCKILSIISLILILACTTFAVLSYFVKAKQFIFLIITLVLFGLTIITVITRSVIQQKAKKQSK